MRNLCNISYLLYGESGRQAEQPAVQKQAVNFFRDITNDIHLVELYWRLTDWY